jgi:hypothetical protein
MHPTVVAEVATDMGAEPNACDLEDRVPTVIGAVKHVAGAIKVTNPGLAEDAGTDVNGNRDEVFGSDSKLARRA